MGFCISFEAAYPLDKARFAFTLRAIFMIIVVITLAGAVMKPKKVYIWSSVG